MPWHILFRGNRRLMDNKVEIRYPKEAVLNFFTTPSKYLKDSYARVFLNKINALGKDRNLSSTDLRVLMSIIGHLGYDNIVNISQKDLGKELNIKQPNIAKSIKKLIDEGYLQVVDTIGRQNIYMLNPNIAFRARAKNLRELKKAWDNKTTPKTIKIPIDIETDLEPELEEKLDDKVEELSKQIGVPPKKVRQIILSLVDLASISEEQNNPEIPY